MLHETILHALPSPGNPHAHAEPLSSLSFINLSNYISNPLYDLYTVYTKSSNSVAITVLAVPSVVNSTRYRPLNELESVAFTISCTKPSATKSNSWFATPLPAES